MKLKIEDVRKALPITVSKNGHFEWWDTLMRRDKIAVDFDVYLPTIGINLQRPYVWTLDQKQQFILSILKEIPVPKVSIIKYWSMEPIRLNKIEVIDGKQRMSAFIEFCNNGFPLTTGHYFDDFADDCKMCIFRFYTGLDMCTVYDDDVISDADKIAWFEMINFTGTPQDESHLLNLKSKL